MQMSQDNSSLLETFNSVMSGNTDKLRTLINGSDLKRGDIDLDYMRGIACYSLNGLRGILETTEMELAATRAAVDVSLIDSGNTMVQDSTGALDAVFERDLVNVGGKVKSLGSFVPIDAIRDFADEKRMISSLNQHVSSLSDFIELPNMLESCISSGYYSEAVMILDYFRTLSGDHRDTVLSTRVRSQMEQLETTFIRNIELKLSNESSMTFEGVKKILPVLLGQRGEPDNITLGRELYLVGRMAYFNSQKEKCMSKRDVNVKEYATLIRSVLCEELFVIYTQMGTYSNQIKGMDQLCRVIAKEVHEFKTFLQKPTILPFLFERGNLLVVNELHACIVDDLGTALRNINCDVNFNHLFHELCLSHFIDPRLRPQTILAVFNSDLKAYNWEPFTSLTDNVDNHHVMQLTRHKPLALLHNQFVNVLNELRHFPLETVSNKVVDYVDIACAQCFDSLLATNAASPVERTRMIRNFCVILVKVLEINLQLLFGTPVDLIIVKSHQKFLTEMTESIGVNSGSDIPLSPSIRSN